MTFLLKGMDLTLKATKLLIHTALVTLLLQQSTSAFTVVKNVNSDKPPVEQVVIFEKGKPADHLSFVDDPNCKLSFTPAGAIECRIIGGAEIKPLIKWKPRDGVPAGIRLQDYDYLILTCRLEGDTKVANAQGRVTSQRPDNLWFGFTLFDTNGERLGSASLADPTPDKKTPDKTTVLKFPMSLIKFWDMENKGEVQDIGFPWSKPHPNITREFRLIIDKIVLADDPKPN